MEQGWFKLALSQWEMSLQSNAVSHWLGANLESALLACTVYPKKYAHGFCFAVLCCGYTLTDFPISIRLTSLALWQSNDCPSASKATLMNMDKYFMWIHYERLRNHNKAKHNKTVCKFLGIYCIPTFQLITSKWASELSNLQETQKREYREWVMNVHEDTQTTAGTPTYVWVTEAWNESWIMNVSCSQNFGHIEAREAPLVLWDCYVVWICVRSRYHPSIQCLRELLAGLSYLPWKKWLPFWQSTCSNGFFLMKMVEIRFKF